MKKNQKKGRYLETQWNIVLESLSYFFVVCLFEIFWVWKQNKNKINKEHCNQRFFFFILF